MRNYQLKKWIASPVFGNSYGFRLRILKNFQLIWLAISLLEWSKRKSVIFNFDGLNIIDYWKLIESKNLSEFNLASVAT